MSFNLESGKNREINETPPEVKVDSEQLSETEETAENFDDCSLNEVQDSKGNEVNAESLKEAEENYDDCEAKMEEMEEENPELADEDDDFNDCGKETDGQYVAEVTYTTDGEISQEEASAELHEAYNECDDPEDMQQLKENANENEHIEVHNAEVVERPENGDIDGEVSEEEYEQAQEELEETQETLEAQQDAAQEYQEDLENQINKQEDNAPEGAENINNETSENTEEIEASNEVEEATEETEDSDEVEENAEETEDSDEVEENAEETEDSDEVEENAEETEDFDEVEENAEGTEDSDEVEEATEETEASDEVEENAEGTEDSDEVEEATEETEGSDEAEENAEDVESDCEEVDETAEHSDDNSENEEENGTSSEAEETSNDVDDVEADDLEQMDDDTDIEASNINEENVEEDISEKVGEETDTELSDETKEKIENDISEDIANEAEHGKISAEETKEIIDDNVEENIDNIEEQKGVVDEKIDNRADEIVENEDLTDVEAKEQISDEVTESSNETLSDEEVEAIAEEKADDIDEAIEEKKDEKESVEDVEKTAEELESDQAEQSSEKEARSLQERIDGAFDKDEVSADEISDLREENATELQSKIEEKKAAEAELKSKFEEVLSKEKGSEEYKQALQEYNALQDQKADLVEQISVMEKQQDLLDKKSLELREAQIQKGAEAVAASATTLAGVNALQERYDQTYYDRKPDKAELATIREESCSTIKELTDEKDSIRRAMDAKMDEISEYVTSNNMDRYDTAHDLRYQQLSAEYNAMKESYDRIGYSIVKLDENNKEISEHLGDEYISMVELAPGSAISEVNEGIDVPGETNYFIDEAKASEVLSPFKQGNWEQLTIQEQKQAVEKLADYNAEILGVENKPRIIYYNAEDPCDFGGYSAKQNAIYINEYNMHDATETADTISHEYRHKYQHERAEKLETERDLEFKEGFENYIRAEDDYQGYKEQLVEFDARAYAKVIQDKIDVSSEIEATDTKPMVDADGSPTTFEDLNPEKGAVWDVPPHTENYKEVKPPISDVPKTPPSLEHRGFLTNDGERITYEEAVNRIAGNAEKYMSSLDVSDDIKAAVVADIRSELYKQHLEAESRGLGDHGIRHIYGNFERGEQYLASRSDISEEQKLAVLVAQVYHDEGYTIAPNNLGTLKEGNSDSKHDEASLKKWDEHKELYASFLDSKTIVSIDKAIGEHNIGVKHKVSENESGLAIKVDIDDATENAISGVERIKENTSIEADPIVSTVHVCDKLALSQREKFSELLTSDPKLVELTESMNSTLKTLQDEGLGFYEGGKLTSQGKKLLEDYHQVINDHIDSQGYDSEYAQRLKDAVNKDVGFNSGKFSSRMNYIYTPSDCYQYNSETGRNEITVFVIEHSDGTSNDLAYKQVDKLFEDLGLSDSEIKLAKASGGYDFGETRGLSVKIESIKEDDIRQIEAERFQENNDLKEANECIEAGRKGYRELSQKLTEIVSLTDGEDLSYNTYCEVAFRGGVVVDFDEQEFYFYSPAEKEQLVRNVVSNIVLSNTSNILDKQKG